MFWEGEHDDDQDRQSTVTAFSSQALSKANSHNRASAHESHSAGAPASQRDAGAGLLGCARGIRRGGYPLVDFPRLAARGRTGLVPAALPPSW